MARYAYVLVSRDNPRYATMCLLSAISVRRTDPNGRISVVADDTTADRLRAQRHPLLNHIDDLVTAPVDGKPSFISRFLKTTLLQRLANDFIYLDVDTLAAEPFADRMDRPESLQLALDRFPRHPQPEFPNWVKPYFQQMGWRYPTARYFNGGVMFVRATDESERFFREWHRRWQEFSQTTGRINDQPALNSAIEMTGVAAGTLPIQYNAMVRVKESYRWGAKILHLFADDSGGADEGTEYERLITLVESGEPVSGEDIHRAITRHWPLVEASSIRRHLTARSYAGAWSLLWNRIQNGSPADRVALPNATPSPASLKSCDDGPSRRAA